jgi:hypothetical protein
MSNICFNYVTQFDMGLCDMRRQLCDTLDIGLPVYTDRLADEIVVPVRQLAYGLSITTPNSSVSTQQSLHPFVCGANI